MYLILFIFWQLLARRQSDFSSFAYLMLQVSPNKVCSRSSIKIFIHGCFLKEFLWDIFGALLDRVKIFSSWSLLVLISSLPIEIFEGI